MFVAEERVLRQADATFRVACDYDADQFCCGVSIICEAGNGEILTRVGLNHR